VLDSPPRTAVVVQFARTVIGPVIVTVTLVSADVTPPDHPENRYVWPAEVASVETWSSTDVPSRYHPLPLIVPTSETTWRRYSFDHSAWAVRGPDMRIGLEPDAALPAASPVHPLKTTRAPAPVPITLAFMDAVAKDPA